MTNELYNRALDICIKYLDDHSRAETFLNRQVREHLEKEPEDLDENDKEQLAKWVRISAGLLLNDEDAEKFKQEILGL